MFDLYSASGRIPTYTWATKPATYPVGTPIFLSDAGTKGSHWIDDGTAWKPFNGQALLASADAQSATVANSETIKFQYQMPAAFWQVGDILRLDCGLQKSGTTDTCNILVRIGTAGTTADATMGIGGSVLTASQVSGGFIYDIRLESATTATAITAVFLGYGSGTSSAFSTKTIANVSNQLWINLTIASSGVSNTVTLMGAKLFYISKAN